MSGIADTFLQSVVAEIDARKQKMNAIADGLESFFEKLFHTEFPEIDNEVILSIDENDIIRDDDCFFTEIRASNVTNVEDRVRLEIGVNTAGRAYVHLWGNEFRVSDEEGKQNNEGSLFDCDSFTSAQTVAKMLTLIQYHDIEIFGPRIAHVLKDIQAEAPKPQEPPLFFCPQPRP